jgi:hypothetical protein
MNSLHHPVLVETTTREYIPLMALMLDEPVSRT